MNMREMVNERQKEQKKKTEEQRTKNKEQRAKRKREKKEPPNPLKWFSTSRPVAMH